MFLYVGLKNKTNSVESESRVGGGHGLGCKRNKKLVKGYKLLDKTNRL